MTGLALDWKRFVDLLLGGAGLKHAAAAANLALLLVLAYTLAGLTWRLLPAPASAPPPASGAAGTPAAQAPAQRTRDIARWHLFGVPSAVPVPVPASIPETKLNLILRGVVVSGEPHGSGAIIAVPGGDEEFYGVGEALPGNAVLKEVHPDRVTLLRGDRLETLRLPRESLSSAEPGGAVDERRGIPRPAPPPPGDRSLRDYRDMLLNDPQSVADLVRIQPYRDEQGVVGYRVLPGRDAALFVRLGLRPGDVVTAVNGITLETPAKALGVLQNLTEAGEVQLEVQRNGQPQSLSLSLN